MSKINVDTNEIDKFNRLSSRWWDLNGDFKPLHEINPLRLDFILKNINLNNCNVADIGCGGGILSESMIDYGARVTGIDMAPDVIRVANIHKKESGKDIEYKNITVEELAERSPRSFDVVTCMEMIEHVPNPRKVIDSCSDLLKPNGLVFFSTINRNLKSFIFAILGAEHFLKLLPIGTHQYDKFIKPSEVNNWSRSASMELIDSIGIHYNPLTKNYSLGKNLDVNYIMCFRKLSDE